MENRRVTHRIYGERTKGNRCIASGEYASVTEAVEHLVSQTWGEEEGDTVTIYEGGNTLAFMVSPDHDLYVHSIATEEMEE